MYNVSLRQLKGQLYSLRTHAYFKGFWVLTAELCTILALNKAEFKLWPAGLAQSLGLLLEPAMKGKLI